MIKIKARLKNFIAGFMVLLIAGCSHSERNDHTNPDLYEPVYLTDPAESELYQNNAEMILYENLDKHLTGQPAYSTYSNYIDSASFNIDSASLTPSEEFLLSEGVLPESLQQSFPADELNPNSSSIQPPTNLYINEWEEWRNVNPPPYSTVSYHIYSNYNPYNPYWFDPYWSYTRIRSYHYPFHPAYRYGGSLAFGYWHYPYHHYFYYPYDPRKPRETYTAEKPRENRSGVQRNAAPRFSPAPAPSYSSLLRGQPNRTAPNPSPRQIFESPLRTEYSSNLRRDTLLSTDRSTYSPRIRIETNNRSEPRIPVYHNNRSNDIPTFQAPSTRISPPASSRSGTTTSPRR